MPDIRVELEALIALLDAQIRDLIALRTEYERRPEVRVQHTYLATWFPSRVDALERQRAVLVRAASGMSGDELVHALGWFRSLGQAFDVDLSWAERGEAVFARLGEMQRRASTLRATIRAAASAA